MRNPAPAALLIFLALAAAHWPARKAPGPPPKVLPPAACAAPFRLEGSTVVYEANGLAAAARLLKPDEEAAYWRLRAGKDIRLFSDETGASPFWVFVLAFKNHSDKTLFFNPGYVSLETEKRGNWNCHGITDLMAFYRARGPEAEALAQPLLEGMVWHAQVSIPPGGEVSRLIVFPPLPAKPKVKAMFLECSWLTLGQETFHLRFPFALEQREGGAGKR